ncbi:MAG: hypothetical protein KGZ86_06355 [Candidatus Latescibacteria bacterium]|nr:hypothetical protein [Candidatus Latescibacterota bacterium]
MKNLKLLIIILSLSILYVGCKKQINQVQIADLGFFMQLPASWQVDPQEQTVFFETAKQDDNQGMVVDYDLDEGESLAEFIDSLIVEEQQLFEAQKKIMESMQEDDDEIIYETKILSRNPLTVDGLNAVELVSIANYTVHEVFIEHDEAVINVSFRCLPEDYPKNEPLFRKAIESIKIKRD